MSKRREQISIKLEPELREFVAIAAEREDRSVAGQVRHIVAEAKRRTMIQTEAAAR